jgi:hypothetical protein
VELVDGDDSEFDVDGSQRAYVGEHFKNIHNERNFEFDIRPSECGEHGSLDKWSARKIPGKFECELWRDDACKRKRGDW